jgi:hypothetical protein
MTNAIGFDAGTFHLATASRNTEDPSIIKYKKEVNAYIKIAIGENPFAFKMLEASGVKMIKKDDFAYCLGSKAMDLAFSFRSEIKRPMKNGILNNTEPESYSILMSMIHGMIGKISQDMTVLYYSVPGPSVNQNINADTDFHAKMLDQIFKKYQNNGMCLRALPLNEALAVIFAGLTDKAFTGIGLSFGGGQVNFAHAIYSQLTSAFSSINSGDWIDHKVAEACGEPIAVVNKEKMKLDLTQTPQGILIRSLHAQYEIMLEKTITNIKKALQTSEYQVKSEDPIDIVIAGGTASPNGFQELFSEIIKKANLPIPIGEIKRLDDPLFSVVKGLLIAAENSQF